MDGFKEFYGNISNQQVISFYNHNPDKPIKEISQLFGKSVGEIYRILHKYNVTPNRQKTNHHNVINFYNFGYGVPQIAEFTGYTERNVRIIIKNKWARDSGLKRYAIESRINMEWTPEETITKTEKNE